MNVFENTVWLSQKQMAALFDRDRKTITRHISNIFKEKELEENSVCSDFEHTAEDGKIYNVTYYNLDVIISVGYRVKSQRGTQFRKWATDILRQYLLNGYVINENRIRAIEEQLKNLTTDSVDLKNEVKQINQTLLQIAARPITINFMNEKLEEKIIQFLDKLIAQIVDEKVKTQIEEVKKDIAISPKNQKTKNSITQFFTDLGDEKSNLHKTIKGIGISKKIISELIKLGEKFKDLFLH